MKTLRIGLWRLVGICSSCEFSQITKVPCFTTRWRYASSQWVNITGLTCLPDFAVTTIDHQIHYLWLEWSPQDFNSWLLLSPCRWTMTTILCINTGRQAGNALPSGFSPTLPPQTSSCPRRRATGSGAPGCSSTCTRLTCALPLPALRLCSVCHRFVWTLNKHCDKCNICPSKVRVHRLKFRSLPQTTFTLGPCVSVQDGREWKHCSACGKCVKPCRWTYGGRGQVRGQRMFCELKSCCSLSAWRHCGSCGRCALPDHPCGAAEGRRGCFSCGSPEHKHRACPHKDSPR